jgi:CheY-like chemotaxis protein
MSSQAIATTSTSQQPKANKSVILSVDDHRLVLLTRQMILEDAGYEVLSAPDGEQALDVFSRTHVDLVLLDYTMPGIDGGVVAAPTVPLVIVSAVPVPEDVLSIADCAITKGRCADVLLNVIRSMLGHVECEIA